jgi:hypothetical protein
MIKPALIFLLSLNAFADDRAIVCPSVTSEASTIINSIQGLKNQIKALPACQPVTEKLTLVSDIMASGQWGKIKSTLADGENFEGEELKAIGELTERASYALNDVIGQITNNRGCIDDKNQASFMAKLSGVVKEVSSVVGNVAGPYGVAVSLGGTLLSSAISGIDKFYKAKHPYQFSNPDEELLFMNQFCSYVEIQKDMNDYLSLDVRPEELTTVHNYLRIKQKDLRENCPECNALEIAWNTQEKSMLIIKRITDDANIVEAGKDQTHSNYTRCNEINRAIHTDNSDLQQFFELLGGYDNPMSSKSDISLLRDISMSTQDLAILYPKLTKCWSMGLSEKQKISQDFNNFLRDDILPLGNTIFGQQIDSFKYNANKKYANPLGDYTESTLQRSKWISAERERVKKKLGDPNYDTSVQVIITHKKNLEERIFDDLMVDYLKFLKKRNTNQLSDFIRGYEKFTKKTAKEYSKILGKPITSVEQLLKELDKSKTVDKRPFLSLLKDQISELDLTITQSATLDRYCYYMNYMLLTTKQTKNTCADVKIELVEKYKEINLLGSLPKNQVAQKMKWLINDGAYQSSRIKDYSVHLKKWIDRGQARWELKPTF